MNLVTLVGRATTDPTIYENDNVKECILTLAITRKFKNVEGIYETDFISCLLYENMAKNIVDYCLKGDLVGVKGRLQVINNQLCVVAEQVTFLSNKKQDKE